jgi:uncharacterized protein (TIGR01319 family)
MKLYLLVDFGSTYTKVTAVDLAGGTLVGRAQAPTTIETDVRIGLDRALAELMESCGLSEADIAGRYACSSAAGGLKMVAIGLVPALTLKAAQRAALGAGAKVTASYGYEIDHATVREIEAQACDIILLCGGTDGGNSEVIVHNAQRLAQSTLRCPILVCGNRSASEEVCRILEGGGKRVYVSGNVLPNVETVDIGPAQELIRQVFIEHIVQAKGLDKAKSLFDRDIIPTPSASLETAKLLADGTGREGGIGGLLVAEVGGATTNVHSVADVKPATQQTIVRGLPEARVNRTVEGDLGLRFNARSIYEFAGADVLTALVHDMDPSVPAESVDPDAYTAYLGSHTDHVPTNRAEALLDCALAQAAVAIAVERHAGTVKQEFSIMGEISIQHGKNYLEVPNILGVGGIYKYGARPDAILEAALFDTGKPWNLKPQSPAGWVDSSYLFYAVGLLSQDFPDEALRIAKRYLKPLPIRLPQLPQGGDDR